LIVIWQSPFAGPHRKKRPWRVSAARRKEGIFGTGGRKQGSGPALAFGDNAIAIRPTDWCHEFEEHGDLRFACGAFGVACGAAADSEKHYSLSRFRDWRF
jgi:hypothetical protein